MLKGVNWLGVLVGVILVQLLGFLWYGPLFGAMWHDLDPSAPVGDSMNLKMALGVLDSVVMVAGLGWLFSRLGVTALVDGVTTAVIVCLVFVITLVVYGWLYGAESLNLVLFNSAYEIIAFVLAGAALTLARLPKST